MILYLELINVMSVNEALPAGLAPVPWKSLKAADGQLGIQSWHLVHLSSLTMILLKCGSLSIFTLTINSGLGGDAFFRVVWLFADICNSSKASFIPWLAAITEWGNAEISITSVPAWVKQ